MPTITTGLFFLARQRPVTDIGPDGGFRLTMHVRDKQGEHRVEPYVVTWTGSAAKAWWGEHAASMQPGQPLQLELQNPRSHMPSRAVAPEIFATVVRCELAPTAPSWQRRAVTDTPTQAPNA